MEDPFLVKVVSGLGTEKRKYFGLDNEVLKYKGRTCIPSIPEIKKKVLEEAHKSKFAVHPGNTKMYHDLKDVYWWPGMSTLR